MAMTVPRPLQEKHIRNGRRVTVHRRTRPRHATIEAMVVTEHEQAHPGVVHTATPVDAAALVDQVARREVGVTGREFLRNWEGGSYADASDRDRQGRAVFRVARLIATIRREDLPA